MDTEQMEALNKHWAEVTQQATRSAERANAPFVPLIAPTDVPGPEDLQWELMRELMHKLKQEEHP
ncbi:MAG: hypothetical protein WCC37_25185 [Candidatus Sulfotelmatobacter sp.]|jgi:hypothetical protein